MIASVPGVVALVNVLKRFGVSGQWSLLAAIAFGVALNVANLYFAADPTYQAIIAGAVTGLGAAGLWDSANAAGVRIETVKYPEFDDSEVPPQGSDL